MTAADGCVPGGLLKTVDLLGVAERRKGCQSVAAMSVYNATAAHAVATGAREEYADQSYVNDPQQFPE